MADAEIIQLTDQEKQILLVPHKFVDGHPVALTQAEIDAMNAEWAANDLIQAQTAYIKNRQSDPVNGGYPKIEDQLDLIYHSLKAGDANLTQFTTAIDAVKQRFPKPTT